MRLNEREIHGATPMAGNKGLPLIVRETDDKVIIQEGYADKLTMSANSARFLARKLNRLALRIEKRAAIATEARRAETEDTGSVHEDAGPKDIAQTTPPSQPRERK